MTLRRYFLPGLLGCLASLSLVVACGSVTDRGPDDAAASGGAGPAATGGSATGGSATGGSSAAGGRGGASGGSGGSASGGTPGSGAFEPLRSLRLGGSALPIDDAAFDDTQTSCTPPCAVALQENGELGWPDALTAAIYIDFEAPLAVVEADMSAGNADQFVIGFSYEVDYGYHFYTSGFWSVYTTNIEYVGEDELSMWQDEIMTVEVVNVDSGAIALIAFSFGEQLLRVHEVRVPTCGDVTTTGACTNQMDCPSVDTGEIDQLSSVCSACYQGIDACTASHCADTCPGQGGNVCMACQVEAGCHDEFMACSGLDYVPMNSLTFPL